MCAHTDAHTHPAASGLSHLPLLQAKSQFVPRPQPLSLTYLLNPPGEKRPVSSLPFPPASLEERLPVLLGRQREREGKAPWKEESLCLPGHGQNSQPSPSSLSLAFPCALGPAAVGQGGCFLSGKKKSQAASPSCQPCFLQRPEK